MSGSRQSAVLEDVRRGKLGMLPTAPAYCYGGVVEGGGVPLAPASVPLAGHQLAMSASFLTEM